VLRTLLHEGAHSLAHATDVKDTSHQGRWHNKRFAALAHQMGLVVESDRCIGHVTPGLLPETVAKYKNVLQELEEALTLFQMPEPPKRGGKTNRQLKATCPVCSRIIRLSRISFEQGPIICFPCEAAFQLAEY
jgi:hypothetical protein